MQCKVFNVNILIFFKLPYPNIDKYTSLYILRYKRFKFISHTIGILISSIN